MLQIHPALNLTHQYRCRFSEEAESGFGIFAPKPLSANNKINNNAIKEMRFILMIDFFLRDRQMNFFRLPGQFLQYPFLQFSNSFRRLIELSATPITSTLSLIFKTETYFLGSIICVARNFYLVI